MSATTRSHVNQRGRVDLPFIQVLATGLISSRVNHDGNENKTKQNNQNKTKQKQHRHRENALVGRKAKISLEGTFALLRETKSINH